MASRNRPTLTSESGLLSQFRDYWIQQIEAARKAKKGFSEIAMRCDSFYKKTSGFMWEPEFKKRYLDRVEIPKFAITIQKAFELVAIFGPYLYWQNPYRRVQARQRLEFPAELFVDPNNPLTQQYYAQRMQEQAQQDIEAEWRAILMERYLNYSQREQPDGLAEHVQFAINDALVKGRGCLWPERYQFPGDSRTLTGMFYDSVDNLFIDPDCRDPGLKTAGWIARKHVNKYWEVERRFNLEKDSLKGRGSHESNTHRIADYRARGRRRREVNNENCDEIVWYEIFSRVGVGTRDSNSGQINSAFHAVFEEDLGDFAYLAISPSVDYPLNLPPQALSGDYEDVVDQLGWPCPCYADHRWPVALLDFYPDTDGCWPIAPMAPGLGELMAMNILLSAFLENSYENRKTLIAIAEEAVEQVEAAMKSTNSTNYIKLRTDLGQSVKNMVEILQRPEMNNDPLKALEYLGASFDKRVGLSEHLYATSSTQSRSARDVMAKEEKSSIRPEKMANDVAQFITDGSQIEAFLAVIYVSGESLHGLLGGLGSEAWDRLISSMDIIDVYREMSITIEASDVRKPNKARDAENAQVASQMFLPILQAYAGITGDSNPMNALIRSYGESTDMDTSDWEMGQWSPPTDPEMAQKQQQMVDLELAEKAAGVEKTHAETEKIEAEAGVVGSEVETEAAKAQIDMAKSQQEFKLKEMEFAMESRRDEQKHEREEEQAEEKHSQQMQQSAMEFHEKMRQNAIFGDMRMSQMRQQQQMREQSRKTSKA